MPQNFIACDREQELLLPPSLREWLADDHLAWFVIDAVDRLDLTAFLCSQMLYSSRSSDARGVRGLDRPREGALSLRLSGLLQAGECDRAYGRTFPSRRARRLQPPRSS